MEFRRRAEGAREDAGAQAAVSKGVDAAADAPFHQIFVAAADHRIGRLDDIDLRILFALQNLILVEVGNADVADLAVCLQLVEGGHRLFQRDLVIRPVDEIKVDIVGLQTPQRAFAFVKHIRIGRIPAGFQPLALPFERRSAAAKLGCQQNLAAIQPL